MFRFIFTLFVIHFTIPCSFSESPPLKNIEEIVLVLENSKVEIFEKKKIVVQDFNDSRCPKGSQCVWAGNVTMKLKWGDQTFALSAPLNKPVEMMNYKIISVVVNEKATQATLKLIK